ncbi:hypothetical protein E0W41_07400 [Neisseria meningitidis]|nr:hypothetical protein [Neisseria meningitidis]
MTRCRFPYGWVRHSRAGGNLDLRITAIFKDYKRPVIPAQAGIQNVKSKETVLPDKFLCRQT